MVVWYIHYNKEGQIQEVQPDAPYKGSTSRYLTIDDYSPADQIEIFSAWRKIPKDVVVVENPITKKPRLEKIEKSNSIHIKSNLIEIVQSTNAQVELTVEEDTVSMKTHFEFNGTIVVYVTEKDPGFAIDTLNFTKDKLVHKRSYQNKRFFVAPYDKTFTLKLNKYTTQE